MVHSGMLMAKFCHGEFAAFFFRIGLYFYLVRLLKPFGIAVVSVLVL